MISTPPGPVAMPLPSWPGNATILFDVVPDNLPISNHRGVAIVFLFEPDRTQLDLNFRVFGIPVRVHPMFWLVT